MKRLYGLCIGFVSFGIVLYLLLQQSGSLQPFVSVPQPPVNMSERITGIVVPHFDGAADLRQQLFLRLTQQTSPVSIVVISVNHYNAGRGNIITTSRDWRFIGTSPQTNQALFGQLIQSGVAVDDDAAFLNEHGISSVLPDVATAFPATSVLPIIIRDTTSQQEIDELLQVLSSTCSQCLLVGSIDFSHYNPNSLATLHDQMSLKALVRTDATLALAAETDSPQTLYLLTQWALQTGSTSFHLDLNTNSGEVAGTDDSETVSYILGYYSDVSEGAYEIARSTTFLFGGDLMFDRGVYHAYKAVGIQHVFDMFGKRVFWGTDIAVANLEGPISDTSIDDAIESNNLTFLFPPDSPAALQFIGLNAVSLGNNHSLNAGQEGLQTTKRLLRDVGVEPIGQEDVLNETSIYRFMGDIPVSVIGVNLLTKPSQASIEDFIRREHDAGQYVIVFPHWGLEYQPKHSPSQQVAAEAWIDAGADLVIGSHPHVVQDAALYNGKPIIYSLGNFVFDQTFSKETQEGLLVGGLITDEALELSFFPISLQELSPRLVGGREKQRIIQPLVSDIGSVGAESVRTDTIRIKR